MADDVKVRVRLDTKQARSQLDNFVREGARTAGRVSGRIRNVVGRGLGVVGLGAAFGTGLAAARQATESGFGDVIGELLGPLGNDISETLFGTLNEDARATKSAREETIQAFGAVAGRTGAVPPGAVNFFESVKTLRLEEEKGRELFLSDRRFRPDADVEDVIDRIISGLGELISRGFRELGDRLLGTFNPFR